MGRKAKTQKQYAEFYGVSERTIRGWLNKGRDKDRIPPLDDPSGMVLWWKETMSQRVPDKLLSASQVKEVQGSEILVSDSGKPSLPKEPESLVPMEVNLGEGSANESLAQLNAIVSLHFQNYKKELSIGNLSKAEVHNAHWMKALEAQRKWAKDAQKFDEERGLLIQKDVFDEELTRIFGAIGRAVKQGMRRVAEACAPSMPESERLELITSERDRCFAVLRDSEFSYDARA